MDYEGIIIVLKVFFTLALISIVGLSMLGMSFFEHHSDEIDDDKEEDNTIMKA